MPVFPFLLATLCVLAIFYRYYSAFIAAKVLALDPKKKTPAYENYDGHNYYPTNKWVLFGHHFAAISGAGPLIGPVLAAQFGFLPGFLWLLIGVVLAGAVHDFILLAASVRTGGKSIVEIAKKELGVPASIITSAAVLFVIVIALAGLGVAFVNALHESAWGTFTLASSIPLAFAMGIYMYKIKGGTNKAIRNASFFGVLVLLGFVVFGKQVQDSSIGHYFILSKNQITLSIAIYGFLASILPVWLLLCPRDYLSSYLKLGTIALLIIAVFIVQPDLKMPAFTQWTAGGGPVFSGKLFPYVFITIACGAISGFHGLIASGTTPKMIKNELDIRPIGYGAMLLEGLVGIVALIATAALYPEDYFAINVTAEKFSTLGMTTVNLNNLEAAVGEHVTGRTGGAVSLAVGIAQIFSSLPFMKHLLSYWYHFAIMFEALFILTTIDTGTRVGRFLVQETFAKTIGKIIPAFKKMDYLPSSILATALVVSAWSYFICTGSISTIWPMFGVANQLLACISLCIATTYLVNKNKRRYIWITLLPLCFIATTTIWAGILNITEQYIPQIQAGKNKTHSIIQLTSTALMISCLLSIIFLSIKKWVIIKTKHK